ncbi:MAG: ShlB/FhaC/HecB family hemolysin secretion/activation protein [Gammaproteobacteria bacterium]|nr:ShlB/FhaC/HecB family hemolysin secretion/activation protein [Gammaproteobacteria bacterium]
MSIRILKVALAICLSLGAAVAVRAQTSLPGNPLDRLPLPTVPAGATGVAPEVEGKVPQGVGADGLARQMQVRRFDIEGVSAVPFEKIADLFQPLMGRRVSVAQMVAAATAATAVYRDAGYPLAFVFVPGQSLDDGVVRVVAVEGYVSDVRIEGDAGASEAQLRAMTERLQHERPLRLETFERVSQLLARLPGLNVVAEASLPTTTSGQTALTLKVKRKPSNLSLGADLRQPRSRAVLTGTLNDPLLPGSQLNASTLLGDPSQERLVALGYVQYLGADGLAFNASYANYRGYPDSKAGPGSAVERLNTNQRLDLSLAFPLLLRATRSVTLSGGFYAVDNIDHYRASTGGGRLDDVARVRGVYAQLASLSAGKDQSRNASLRVTQGIDGLGATSAYRSNIPGLVAPAADLAFTRLNLDLGQRDRFANRWGTAFSFGGQYSAQALPSPERVSFGGARFGRGYGAGDASGDSGWGASAEINRQFTTPGTWLKQIEPYLLVEAAEVSARQALPSPRKLGSVAVGVRVSDARHYSIDLALAKPTGDASATNPGRKTRVSLLMSYQLDP